nr:hypothetical protein [Tanacetum cinerariifolium]
MGTSSGLKTWCLAQCGVKNRSAMTNMLSGESLIGGTNINNSTDLQSTRSLLEMSTQNVESLLLPNIKLSTGTITSIWIGSRCVEMMTSYTSSKKETSRGSAFKTLKICYCFLFKKPDKSDGRRTICFLRLSKNVYKKHHHPTTCGRSSTRCQKLAKEAQPHKNKDKQNRLMRIDELHKFSDGTLNDVRTALDDHLRGDCTRETSGCFNRPYDLSYDDFIIQRYRYSNPMIQLELEGSTQGYLLVNVEILKYDKRSKRENMGIVPTEMELILEHTQQSISHEVSVSAEGVKE